jgi:hypothetical protein
MSSTQDFIGAVYEKLTQMLGSSGASASTLVQMAWPGYALSPVDFRRSESPAGPYDPDVAREVAAALANIAPASVSARFENSGLEIDDLYEIVLASAIPMGATADNLPANPIYRLFSDAQFEFMNARRGLRDDPNGYYYPVTATPAAWYDESKSEGWTTVTLSTAEANKSAPPSNEFIRAGGKDALERAVWRLRPKANQAGQVKADLQKAVTAEPLGPALALKLRASPALAKPMMAHALKVGLAPAAPAPAPVSAATLRAGAPAMAKAGRVAKPSAPAAAPTPAPVLTKGARLEALRGGGAAKSVDLASAKRLFTAVNAPSPVLSRPGVNIARIDLTRRDLGIANLAERLVLKERLDQALPTKPASPATNGYSITFKVCRVNLQRPWLKLALLSTRNWWMFDTPAGTYSTGATDNNPGLFPLLPTGLIVIRDLKITANWSQEDRANIGEAASFGPFDLQGATLSQNTLEVKGMQVIGWISQVTPSLPPLSPPAV